MNNMFELVGAIVVSAFVGVFMSFLLTNIDFNKYQFTVALLFFVITYIAILRYFHNTKGE